LDWSCSFNRKELRCTRESIAVNGCQVLKVEDGYFSVSAECVPSPQKQMLHEDAGNLSSVPHYLMTEKRGSQIHQAEEFAGTHAKLGRFRD
jgi:hypothetical protein